MTLSIAFFGYSQTCTGEYYPHNQGETITFTAGSYVLPSEVQDAIDMWNTCPGVGLTFPELTMSGSGTISIDVTVRAGMSTTNSGGCGVFNHELDSVGRVVGGTIVLFDADILGHDCEPNREDTIAHEIGHVLGLADSGCDGYIMSGSSTRSVQSDECAAAGAYWETPAEQPPPPNGDGLDQPYLPSQQGAGDPLVLDLNGDGIHTTSLAWPVSFDMLGNGTLTTMAWTNPETEEGFLWIDMFPNNTVDDGRELFGTGTLLPSGQRASDGFEALSIYDDPAYGGNADGVIDITDGVWSKLRLWVDRDHDGRSVPQEVLPIHAAGVLAIRLASSSPAVSERDEQGNLHVIRTTYSVRDTGNHIVWRAVHNLMFAVAEP